jgi:hypothetical protein
MELWKAWWFSEDKVSMGSKRGVGALPFDAVVGVKRWLRWLSPVSTSVAMGRVGKDAWFTVNWRRKKGGT